MGLKYVKETARCKQLFAMAKLLLSMILMRGNQLVVAECKLQTNVHCKRDPVSVLTTIMLIPDWIQIRKCV